MTIFPDDSVESIVAIFGILIADAVFLMLVTQLKAPKRGYIFNSCEVKALISDVSK